MTRHISFVIIAIYACYGAPIPDVPAKSRELQESIITKEQAPQRPSAAKIPVEAFPSKHLNYFNAPYNELRRKRRVKYPPPPQRPNTTEVTAAHYPSLTLHNFESHLKLEQKDTESIHIINSDEHEGGIFTVINDGNKSANSSFYKLKKRDVPLIEENSSVQHTMFDDDMQQPLKPDDERLKSWDELEAVYYDNLHYF